MLGKKKMLGVSLNDDDKELDIMLFSLHENHSYSVTDYLV